MHDSASEADPTGRAPRRSAAAQTGPPFDVNRLPVEVRLLLTLDRPRRLTQLAQECDWLVVDRLTREQRLTGRLLRALEAAGTGDAIPTKLRRQWRTKAARAAVSYRDALGQLERLSVAFESRGVNPCLLKGPVLVLLDLNTPGGRPFGDLDLLVPRTHLDDSVRAMHDLGYIQRIDPQRRRWARMSHYHDPRWVHPEERFPVEVHWDIARPDQPLAFEIDTLTTVPVPLPAGPSLLRPDDADLLSHICLHFWDDRAAGKPHSIGQLWDVADMSMRLDEESWQELWHRADRRGHSAVLGAVLATVRVLLDRPELERFPQVADQVATTELVRFAHERVCDRRPPHVQLLAPYDDVHFGVGRFLKQHLPWAYSPHSPLRWWPSIVATRLAAAGLRSGRALGQIYGTEPSVRLRLSYLWELAKLLGNALRQPCSTIAQLRIERWALRISRSGIMRHRNRARFHE